MVNLKKISKRKKKVRKDLYAPIGSPGTTDTMYDLYSGLTSCEEYPSYENVYGRIGPAPTADQQFLSKTREDLIYGIIENSYGNLEDKRTEPASLPGQQVSYVPYTINSTRAAIPPPLPPRNVTPKLLLPHSKLPLPPCLHKNGTDRHGVLQKMSDITLTDSTFQADVHQAPHVKIETFVCCTIHVDDTNCDCKTNRNNGQKSKFRRFHKLLRRTSIVVGLYWIYNLHKIFETP